MAQPGHLWHFVQAESPGPIPPNRRRKTSVSRRRFPDYLWRGHGSKLEAPLSCSFLPPLTAMKPTLRYVLAALLVFTVRAPLSGQAHLTVKVAPRAGILSPDRYLYEQYTNFSGDGPVEWTDGYLRRALVLGAGFEVGREGGAVLLRGEVARSFGGWLAVARSIVQPRQLYDAPYIETTWLDVPAAVTMAALQLVIPTRLVLWRAQPYVLLGAGGKRYDFGEPTTANDVNAILPYDGFTWGGEVGAGLTLPVKGLTLDVQGRDAISRYWGKTEHDMVFSTALLWRIR